MGYYRAPKKLGDMDRVERAENNAASKAVLTEHDLVGVAIVAQIETKLDEYRYGAEEMKRKTLVKEEHDSAQLGNHLAIDGDPKPHKKCHAHAIVSGAHKQAAPLRTVLAHFKLRIDDSYNGCWLPENTKAKAVMPRRLKRAVPHSRIHRFNYYFWLKSLINMTSISEQDHLKYTLKTIGQQLQAGTQAGYVMLKKGEGLLNDS